jgi:hypothetical protein
MEEVSSGGRGGSKPDGLGARTAWKGGVRTFSTRKEQ